MPSNLAPHAESNRITGRAILAQAPMAGITDAPFRTLCRRFGANWTVSEMVLSNPALQNTPKNRARLCPEDAPGASAIQISGSDPRLMADLAQAQVASGARAIDINMGCPVKKVCRKNAGSALLRDEALVTKILATVVAAVNVPVTLKTRLGWDANQINIVAISHIAAATGIAALAIHGRTREQSYSGPVDYDMIATVKRSVSIPVWANGDIRAPEIARQVLLQTGADGVMIGRGTCGQPWLWRDVAHYLAQGVLPERIGLGEASDVIRTHLEALYNLYGDQAGLRIARKHLCWYLQRLPGGQLFCTTANRIDTATDQFAAVNNFLNHLPTQLEMWPCAWRDHEANR